MFNSSPLGPTLLPLGLQAFALTGDTYDDERGLVWYQMSTAGAVYHYPGAVTWYKKLDAAQKFQSFMPVFKLISPDETGGSNPPVDQDRRSPVPAKRDVQVE